MPIIQEVKDGKFIESVTSGKTEAQKSNELGYDQFLQILCAEMQYQDPLEPTSNTDYVAQMATFSQLEAMLSMSETEENSMASSLVGKQVILKVTSETTGATSYVDGRVDYVMYENGEIMLSVNDGLYPLSSLDTVADSEYYEGVTLASTFTNMIGELPLAENLTLAWDKAIVQLRELYDGMTSYQQQFVSDDAIKTLVSYEEKMQILKQQEEAGSTEDGSKQEPETV